MQRASSKTPDASRLVPPRNQVNWCPGRLYQLRDQSLQLPEIRGVNATRLEVGDRVQKILGAGAPMTAGLGQNLCRLRQRAPAIGRPFAVDGEGDCALRVG